MNLKELIDPIVDLAIDAGQGSEGLLKVVYGLDTVPAFGDARRRGNLCQDASRGQVHRPQG